MTGLIADTRAAIAAAMQRATVRIVVLILVEFFFELIIQRRVWLASRILPIVCRLLLCDLSHERIRAFLGCGGFEDLNHLGSLRVNSAQ